MCASFIEIISQVKNKAENSPDKLFDFWDQNISVSQGCYGSSACDNIFWITETI